MPPILTSAEYPWIRSAIDINLDEVSLPDATIELPIFLTAAETEVTDQLTTPYASLDAGDQLRVKLAIAYITAALLVVSLPQFKSERSVDGQTYERTVVDPMLLANILRGRASSELAQIVNAGVLAAAPVFFTVASGRRGRLARPIRVQVR